MLVCESCQDLVRVGASVLAAGVGRRQTRKGRVAAVAVVAIAATVLIIARASDREDPLGRLDYAAGQFEPVRSVGPAIADSGLTALSLGNARAAVTHLSRAFAADTTPGVAFFLAVSQLLANEPEQTIGTLDAIAHAGAGPYTADAAYVRAKAWIRLGAPDSALAALAAQESLTAPGATYLGRSIARNAAFADSIRRTRQ
jgi:hypothetical protein